MSETVSRMESSRTLMAGAKQCWITSATAKQPSDKLVTCLTNSWRFAARDFGLQLGASDEHTPGGSVRSEQRRGRPKELRPEGLRRKWPEASLLLGHRSLRICSLVAPQAILGATKHQLFVRHITSN